MAFPAAVGVLYVPVAVWVATGLGLLLGFRRSAPPVVLRLAATFLALWALFATTTLLWVLSNGGAPAVVALLRSPLLLFDPRFALLWTLGAVGAFVVFAVAFLLNQMVGRGFLRLLHPKPLAWPMGLPRPSVSIALFSFPSGRPQAFSFTLAEFRRGPRRREVILLSEGLLTRLTPAERTATVAHEVGHLCGLDGRYLTFLRTLARMMRWDPLLAYLTTSLTRREEVRADLEAARMTRDPLALARALFKVSALTPDEVGSGVVAFLGGGGARGRRELLDRIRRLVLLAESPEFREARGG